MKNIYFNALVMLGSKEKKLAFIIEGVDIFPGRGLHNSGIEEIGFSVDNLEESLKKSGFEFDWDSLSLLSTNSDYINILDEDDFYENEDYIQFKGIPLQFTGFKDKSGAHIYHKHVMGGAVVEWDDKNGMWGLKYPKNENLVPLCERHLDYPVVGYDFPLGILTV